MISQTVGSLVLVLCIGTSLGQLLAEYNFAWNEDPIEVTEGGGTVPNHFGFLDVTWPYGNSKFRCTISNPAGLIITESGQPTNTEEFKKSKPKRKYLFKGKNDNLCNDVLFTVKMTCKILMADIWRPIKIKKSSFVVKMINTDPANACEDPHLSQRVSGIDAKGESVTKQICYDLYGKSGDQLELITDNLLRTSAVFELRDDYYIGKAFYSTKLGIFNFTTTTITLPSLQVKKWGLEDNFVIGNRNAYPHAVVKLSQHDVSVVYNEKHRSQSIRIVKIQQSYGKSYLNVLVEKSTTRNGVFDEYHGGIFGVIANQEYEFYEPMQKEGGRAVVKINGRLVNSFLKDSPGQTDSCYTLSLEDVIYPMNVHSFQKSL